MPDRLIFLRIKKKKKEFRTNHLIANMFPTAATTLVYALLLIPLVYLLNSSTAFLVGTFVFLIFETLFRAWTYFDWMHYSGWKKILKVLAYSILVTLIWSLISAGAGFLYIGGVFD